MSFLLVTIVIDVVGQVCFKHGLKDEDHSGAVPRSLIIRVITSPLIALGVAAYAAELVLWLYVLAHVPLSVAFPAASLAYCGVALASKFILKEYVSTRRWIGTGLIAVGVAIVSATT